MSDTTKHITPPRRRRTAKQSAPAIVCAALEQYIERTLREARRAQRKAERACAQSPVDYWSGNIAALVNLRTELRRTMKAPHSACDKQSGLGVPERLIPAEVAALEAALRDTIEAKIRAHDAGEMPKMWGLHDDETALERTLRIMRRRAATGGNAELSERDPKTL